MNVLRVVFAVIVLSAVAQLAFAQDQEDVLPETNYFERHAEGWFWYQDPPAEQTKEDTEASPRQALPPTAPPTPDPVAQLDAFRKDIETALATAIVDPTENNVKTYMALNQAAMQRSQDFALSMRRTLWTTPEFDYSLTHPVNDQAVHVFRDEENRQTDAFLRATARDYGMFFFFKGACPYCHKLAPILARFAETYGFRIIPVSLDGGALPEFPNPRTNAQAAVKLKVDTVPAVFLVHPRKGDVYPVAFGFVGWQELRERIFFLLNPQRTQPAASALTDRSGAGTQSPLFTATGNVP